MTEPTQPLDLDKLEALRTEADAALDTTYQAISVYPSREERIYSIALRNAAPALIAKAREAEEAINALEQMEGVHERAQLAEAALTAAQARIAELEAGISRLASGEAFTRSGWGAQNKEFVARRVYAATLLQPKPDAKP